MSEFKRVNIPGPMAEPTVLFDHSFTDWDYVVNLTQALREVDMIDAETLTSANDIYDRVYVAMEDLIRVNSWEFHYRYCYQRDLFCYEGLDRLVEEINGGDQFALCSEVTWQDVANKVMELVEEATNES